MAESDAAALAKAKPTALRKGALVKVNRAAYSSSLEAGASDPTAPDYIFEGPGKLLVVKGDYGQVAGTVRCPMCGCEWISWKPALDPDLGWRQAPGPPPRL